MKKFNGEQLKVLSLSRNINTFKNNIRKTYYNNNWCYDLGVDENTTIELPIINDNSKLPAVKKEKYEKLKEHDCLYITKDVMSASMALASAKVIHICNDLHPDFFNSETRRALLNYKVDDQVLFCASTYIPLTKEINVTNESCEAFNNAKFLCCHSNDHPFSNYEIISLSYDVTNAKKWNLECLIIHNDKGCFVLGACHDHYFKIKDGVLALVHIDYMEEYEQIVSNIKTLNNDDENTISNLNSYITNVDEFRKNPSMNNLPFSLN